jgi:hypothetical protein
LQHFVNSLGVLFAAQKTGNPQADMIAFADALEPFKEQSIAEFASMLRLAKEYRDTGKITPLPTRQKPAASRARAGASRTPLKTKADTAAIQEAVDQLEKLQSHAADPDLSYATIEATVQQIYDAFDKDGLKEVAKRFNISSGISNKKACREKMEQKIKERKARNEKGEVIAAAAREASMPEQGEEVLDATLVDEN